MKLLSSSSSASSTISTSTSTNFSDGNVYTYKNTTPGCIASVIRRLLCRNSLPTHPADHFREAENDCFQPQKLKHTEVEDDDDFETLSAPSVVARLMGLESMPPLIHMVSEKMSQISRSRSMNSVESSKDFELIQGRHRRAKSFREIPTYVELEDEKFFILSFENGSKSMRKGSKARKSEKGCKENRSRNRVNRRESAYEQNKENFCDIKHDEKEKIEAMISTNCCKKVNCDDVLKDTSNVVCPVKNDSGKKSILENYEKRRVAEMRKDECLDVKIVDPECNSQNSSPNSVLDFVEFTGDREAPSSEVSRVTNSKTRRSLLEEELENYRKVKPCRDKGLISGLKSSQDNHIPLLKKTDYYSHKHVKIWKEISRFADIETQQSNWISKEITKLEDYKKISGDIALEILDKMVEELVDQLARPLGDIR